MKKLKLVMSDVNFTNAMVHDEDGEVLGYVGEVCIRAKRKVMFIRLCGTDNHCITSEDMEHFRLALKESLNHPEEESPFIIFNDAYKAEIGTAIIDDYQVDNAKIIAKQNGEWVSEEDLIVKDIIE